MPEMQTRSPFFRISNRVDISVSGLLERLTEQIGRSDNGGDQPVAASDAVKYENEPPQLGLHRVVFAIH